MEGLKVRITNKHVETYGVEVDSWACDVSMTEGGGEERIYELNGKTYSLVYDVKGGDVLQRPNALAVEVEYEQN